jgi:50S ribosomal protein L4
VELKGDRCARGVEGQLAGRARSFSTRVAESVASDALRKSAVGSNQDGRSDMFKKGFGPLGVTGEAAAARNEGLSRVDPPDQQSQRSQRNQGGAEVVFGRGDVLDFPEESFIRVPVYDFKNGTLSSAGEHASLPADVFGQPPRTDILHRVVRWQLARRQQGTHKTKTRSEVRGGGRKPWQQKGSGRARQGTIRAVQWRGGGVVHGPVPRSHAHDLPRKIRRLGLACAASAKVEEGRLFVVESLDVLEQEKTAVLQEYIDVLLAHAGAKRRSALLVDAPEVPGTIAKSSRNIPWVDVIPVTGLNVYSILQRDFLVMTTAAVKSLVERLRTPIKR